VTAEHSTGHWPKCVALTTPAWPKGSAANGIVTYTAALESALRECGVRPVIVSWHVEPTAIPSVEARQDEHGDIVDVSVFESRHTLANRIITKASRKLGVDTLLRARWLMMERATRAAVARFPVEVLETEETLGLPTPIIRSGLVPVVVRLHGPWFLNGRALGVEEDAGFRRRDRLELEAIVRADAVTAPCRDVLEQTRAHYGLPLEHGCVIPPPVEFDRAAPPWNLADCDRNRIVFVGRFDRHKGGDVMIDAFGLIAAAKPDLMLDFVGPDRGILDGAGRSIHLDEYLAARVHADVRRRIVIHGQQGAATIDKLRRRALVTIVPSRYETFGYTAVEALSLGCPVIAANSGGLADVVRDQKTGLSFDSGDARSLAAQISKLLEAPERAALLGEAARPDVERRYAPRSIAEQTLETYAAAIERRRGRATQNSHRPRPNA
jgi:glycosyltransferase involved in cell wall biosynthesis